MRRLGEDGAHDGGQVGGVREVREAEEPPERTHVAGLRPGSDGRNLLLIHCNTSRGDMSQVMYRHRCEVAFRAFQPQVMVTQCSQECIDVLQMRRPRGTIDQDVVKKTLGQTYVGTAGALCS